MTDHPKPTPAREQTSEEIAAEQLRARALDRTIKDGLRDRDIRTATWSTAKALVEFDEERAWKKLGFDTLDEWLADPEVGLQRTEYYRAIRAYRVFVVERRTNVSALTHVDRSKVDIVVGAVQKGEVTVQEALKDAETHSWRALREKYASKAAQKPAEPAQDDAGSAIGPWPWDVPQDVRGTEPPEEPAKRALEPASGDRAPLEADQAESCPPAPQGGEWGTFTGRRRRRRSRGAHVAGIRGGP